MTELHVLIPDEIAERYASEAAERGVTSEDLVAEVVTSHAPGSDPSSRSPLELSFIGMGHSGRDDLSERVKEIRQASFGA